MRAGGEHHPSEKGDPGYGFLHKTDGHRMAGELHGHGTVGELGGQESTVHEMYAGRGVEGPELGGEDVARELGGRYI